ncbi:hypothetical protein ATJ88_0470 [Isoptericola jiangsuensis]|uniref:T6SS immunity protein Tdi1 C-terminal domain-containing protein n=1 Tax=Isoptericola jiangsuensis TaxID=548579 RepID=A0A2A9ERR4_9MICO|nr:hypothetical protein [Isoptericola jiangsuensis]PFG41827.1 hypothetical protein ATJ88_0470 [Isoptericola jiangsuensis]
MEHLRPFAPRAFQYGLAAWSWLDLAGMTPRLATVFGDVLLESLEGWWFLDTVEGSLELRWPTAVELTAELDSPAGRQDLLLEDLVVEAAAHGVSPGPDEVLTFMPHPVLGGRLSAASAVPVRLELALRMTGELHRQRFAPAPSPLLLGHSLQHATLAPR